MVKLEEFLLSYVITYLVKRYGINLTHGAFRPDLRVHMWCYFIIEVEAAITFPFLIRAYSTADYPGESEKGVVLENYVEEGEESAVSSGDENGKIEWKSNERAVDIILQNRRGSGKSVNYSAVLEGIEENEEDCNVDQRTVKILSVPEVRRSHGKKVDDILLNGANAVTGGGGETNAKLTNCTDKETEKIDEIRTSHPDEFIVLVEAKVI